MTVKPQSELAELRKFALSLQTLVLGVVERINELERKTKLIGRSGGLTVHDNTHHSPNFEEEGLSLLLDGSRAMTGDLDLADNKLLTTTLALYEIEANWMALTNRAGDLLKNLRVSNFRATGNVQCGSFYGDWANSTITPKSGVTNTFLFRANRTGGTDNCARLQSISGAAGSAYFEVMQAGDIAFIANKVLKVGNISGSGTPATQTKYFPIDDSGVTRYLMLYDSVS